MRGMQQCEMQHGGDLLILIAFGELIIVWL